MKRKRGTTSTIRDLCNRTVPWCLLAASGKSHQSLSTIIKWEGHLIYEARRRLNPKRKMSRLNSNSGTATLIGIEQPETLRAPEIEKGVGCDFDNYLLVPDNTLDERIGAAKAKLGKDVVILGHHYQRDEVVKFADFRGDSLKLSFQAAQTD